MALGLFDFGLTDILWQLWLRRLFQVCYNNNWGNIGYHNLEFYQ